MGIPVSHLVTEITLLHPQPGDVLVIRGLGAREGEKLVQALERNRESWPKGLPVLILPKGAEVTLEGIEELRKAAGHDSA